jgi:SAM-dependent methyltransferase
MLANTPPSDRQPYTEAFYARQAEGSRQSAAEIVPLVLGLIPASSVVDVGCGMGAWLSVFREYGVVDALGLDGDYVTAGQLLIAPSQFQAVDLTAPPTPSRSFDLAVSLEVAEHLPATAADSFVTYLTSLAPVVLFSAAIPGQGGVDHVNEQWPEYWASRFQRRGYMAIDCLRPVVWRNQKVQWWYAQNILLFAHSSYVARMPALHAMAERTDPGRLALVHPSAYEIARRKVQDLEHRLRPETLSLRETLRTLPVLLRAAIRRRIR